MIKRYTVHRCSHHPAAVTLKDADGNDVPATVDSLEVELLPAGANDGTVKLSFTGKEIAEAEPMFGPGVNVLCTIEPEVA